MALGIRRFKRLGRFDKAYSRLGSRYKTAVDRALAELKMNDELPPGRNLKRIKSRKNVWAIRVSKGVRLTFEVANGTCILRNVGDHDKTLDDS